MQNYVFFSSLNFDKIKKPSKNLDGFNYKDIGKNYPKVILTKFLTSTSPKEETYSATVFFSSLINF